MITMYNSLSGEMTRKIASNTQCQACLLNQGVEWILEVSRTCLQDLPEQGAQVTLFVYYYTREDQSYLCGFYREPERKLFLDLLKVEGIGPKQALKILSGARDDRLVQMLEEANVEGLEQIPGLGKKTAQKMVLTLKGKLTQSDDPQGPSRQKDNLGEYEDLALALVAMGYDRKFVVPALQKLIPECRDLPPDKKEQELLRRSIIELS